MVKRHIVMPTYHQTIRSELMQCAALLLKHGPEHYWSVSGWRFDALVNDAACLLRQIQKAAEHGPKEVKT